MVTGMIGHSNVGFTQHLNSVGVDVYLKCRLFA